jgi:hypothetical protein
MEEPIWLVARKSEEWLELFGQTTGADLDPGNSAVALVGVKGAVDNPLKYSPRPLNRLGPPSGDPSLAIVDQDHNFGAQRSISMRPIATSGRYTAIPDFILAETTFARVVSAT